MTREDQRDRLTIRSNRCTVKTGAVVVEPVVLTTEAPAKAKES